MALPTFGWRNGAGTTPLSAAELESFGLHIAAYFENGQSPSVVTGSSPGGASNPHPTVLLDSYYDSAAYASKTAAINAAVAAVQALGGTLECRHGRVYSLDTGALSIAPGASLRIDGNEATLQANWGKPRCVDFTRTADYQTFGTIDIRDLTFDANNLTALANQSVVGDLIDGGGVNTQRVNAQGVYLRRCQWKNVPVGTGGVSYHCFSLRSQHAAGGETQTNLIDVRIEQAVMRGGNYGADIIGACPTTTAVEVYHDKIYVDVDHDPGVVPTASAGGANCQIGGLGWGDNCEVHIIGANSSDVGLEIDGMQRADIYGRITDSWNAEFFARNFHAPPDANSQRYVYHACNARVVNLNPDNGAAAAAGFQIGHTSTPNPTFGEAVLDDCSFYSAAAKLRTNGSALIVPTSGLVSRVTVVGTFTASYPNVNDAPGSTQNGTPVFVLPASSTFTLAGGNLRILYAGTGGANLKPRSVVVSPQTGCTMRVDLGDIGIASSLASVSAGNTFGLLIGLSGSGGGSMSGRIRRLGWEAFSGGDTTPRLYVPLPSTTITIDGRLVLDEIDLRHDPAASPQIVNANGGVDATNKAALPIRSANMPTYPIASVAMSTTVFAAANFTTATGNQYIGSLPAEIQFATGTGSAVTAIDVSKDGTTYENVYTQASAALAQSVIVPVECGDFVKVTFATTQPTGRVRFRRAQ